MRILSLLCLVIVMTCLNQCRSSVGSTTRYEDTASVNDVSIWYEGFGDPKKPAILLMMGNGAQGIFWPDQFCQLLAKEHYVIRYDYRDTGKSSYIDFENNPYDFSDMTNDAIGLLDSLGIERAHAVGLSMGGFLVQMLALDHPDRLYSITAMMTTSDYRVLLDALSGQEARNPDLPPMKPEFLDELAAIDSNASYIERMIANWRAANGKVAPFDDRFWHDLIHLSQSRSEDVDAVAHHMLGAQRTARQNLLPYLHKVKVPSLVIQGGQDPIFPPPHGAVTAEAIPGAKLVVIQDMGHALGPNFFSPVSRAILEHVKAIK